jgi:hypothetical protein
MRRCTFALIIFIQAMATKLKNWGKPQAEALEAQFNLWFSGDHEKGWNPEEHEEGYIRNKVLDAEKEVAAILQPYLSGQIGGHPSNKDNSKILRGYRRVASEYFVTLAKGGTRRSTCDFLSCIVLLVFFSHLNCVSSYRGLS